MKNLARFALPALTLAARAIAADAAPSHPCPSGPDTDLWVLAGQSNMQGYGVITQDYPVNPKVMLFDLSEEWRPAQPPTHRIILAAAPVFKKLFFAMNPTMTEEGWVKAVEAQRQKAWGGIGPDWSFAETIAAVTGRKVGLVACALGGTSMGQWNPAGRDQKFDSLYGNMIERIRMVGGRVKGLLWYQGEAESGSQATVDGFHANFLAIVDSVRRDTGIADLPVIYVQIARYCREDKSNEAWWAAVQEKQRTAAALRPNLWVVPAVDLPLDDLIHIGEAGQLRLGRRMAAVALTHVYGVSGHGTPIDYASYEFLPSDGPTHHRMRVRFSGVTGRLEAQGRPTGFQFSTDDPKRDGPTVFKVELDPFEPAAVIVHYSKPVTAPVRLSYGLGLDNYANLTDSLDMAVPAFGPIVIGPEP